MKKYIIYVDPIGLSPGQASRYMKDVLTNLRREGIIGKADFACVISSPGPTRIETLSMSIFEKLSAMIDRYLGKVSSFNDRR